MITFILPYVKKIHFIKAKFSLIIKKTGGEKMSKNAVAEKSAEASLFCDIYRNAKMGADAILNLLPRVNDKELESELSLELSRYEEFAAEARKILGEWERHPRKRACFQGLWRKWE